MDFPEQTSTRRFLLTGDHVRIGRHSSTRGIDAEIDLSGALEDTGVSHRHAVLMRQPEGNWALVDLDSTNGTFLNADAEPILANHPIALSDGDQIHLGGWTTLTIERLDPASVARLEAESRPSKDTRNLARGRRPWEVGLLGPLRLVVSGQEVPITAAKTRAVLALLALRVGAPMSVPDLEWALWGEDEPKTAGTALRGYIASLRKLLPDRAIETTAAGGLPVGRVQVLRRCLPVRAPVRARAFRSAVGSPGRRRGRARPGARALARRAAARPRRRARRGGDRSGGARGAPGDRRGGSLRGPPPARRSPEPRGRPAAGRGRRAAAPAPLGPAHAGPAPVRPPGRGPQLPSSAFGACSENTGSSRRPSSWSSIRRSPSSAPSWRGPRRPRPAGRRHQWSRPRGKARRDRWACPPARGSRRSSTPRSCRPAGRGRRWRSPTCPGRPPPGSCRSWPLDPRHSRGIRA